MIIKCVSCKRDLVVDELPGAPPICSKCAPSIFPDLFKPERYFLLTYETGSGTGCSLLSSSDGKPPPIVMKLRAVSGVPICFCEISEDDAKDWTAWVKDRSAVEKS